MKILKAALIATALYPSTTLAITDGATARFTFTVPLECTAEVVSLREFDMTSRLVIDESCNDIKGYALYLEYEPSGVTAIRYDGRPVAPSAHGRTLLVRSQQPRKHRSSVDIDMSGTTRAFITIAANTGF